MDRIFLTVLNMSLTASFVIAVVMLARFVLRRAPKIISYALWAVVLFNLLCSFKPESTFSLIPFHSEPISEMALVTDADISFDDAAFYSMDFPGEDRLIPLNMDRIDASVNAYGEGVTHRYLFGYQAYVKLGSFLWPIGMAALLLYAIIGYIRLKRRVSLAVRVENNIFETDRIDSPFVLGLIRPRIYIPAGMEPILNAHIIEHERTHIRRRDYIVSVIAFLALALHWFNPLVWIAYMLMLRDMESSCDEAVLRKSVGDIRCEYSSALLGFSHNKRRLSFPLAFGEQSVKERVKNVLNFKKPSRIIIVAALLLVIVLSVGFSVNRSAGEPLIEMQVVYEENPAQFLNDMKLIWGDTVYHVTQISSTGRGREIGYATDDFSTWRIYELRGHGRDYLLAVESEDVWRVMSVYPPEAPWRQYILENATERQRLERLLSVTLFNDGTARLATPPISSFAMAGTYYYSFSEDELLIYQVSDYIIARFEVLDDDTIVFKSSTVPLFVDTGARYVTTPATNERGGSMPDVAGIIERNSNILNQVYLGMTNEEVYALFGEPDYHASGLMWYGYDDIGTFDPVFSTTGLIESISLRDGTFWSVHELVKTAVMQHYGDAPGGEFPAVWHQIVTMDANENEFTVTGMAQYELYLPDGEYGVRRVRWERAYIEMTFAKNANYDYILTSSSIDDGTWTLAFPPDLMCYDRAMLHFVGAIPGNVMAFAIGVGGEGVMTVTDIAAGEPRIGNADFWITYFPGATFQIEPYDENLHFSSNGPGSWVIEYADSGKNISVGGEGTSAIPITDDLIGIYDLNGGRYSIRFEKYVKVD